MNFSINKSISSLVTFRGGKNLITFSPAVIMRSLFLKASFVINEGVIETSIPTKSPNPLTLVIKSNLS